MRSGLRKRAEFQRVYNGGVKCSGEYVVVFALARDGEGCRLGITATRKVGCAVVRNRARRRVRELFHRHPELLKGLAVDLVVNLRRSAAESEWCELERDYLRCMNLARRRLVQTAAQAS
ncbi:MAG: ribonuclease P protein component [Acidobacteriota bacterium]